jgi:hypothetical protein
MAITLTVLLLVTVSLPVFSQQIKVQENSPAIKVKYLQGSKDALLFNLKYDNLSGNKFNLMVLGEGGEVLFQKNYSGRKLRKKIRLTRLTDTEGVIFLIRPAQESLQLSCTVKVPSKAEDRPSETEN